MTDISSFTVDNKGGNFYMTHRLGGVTAVLLAVLIVVIAYAGYSAGLAAAADTDRSRQFATLQNHVRDLEGALRMVHTFDEFQAFLKTREEKAHD